MREELERMVSGIRRRNALQHRWLYKRFMHKEDITWGGVVAIAPALAYIAIEACVLQDSPM